jgi:hypothetical protein
MVINWVEFMTLASEFALLVPLDSIENCKGDGTPTLPTVVTTGVFVLVEITNPARKEPRVMFSEIDVVPPPPPPVPRIFLKGGLFGV